MAYKQVVERLNATKKNVIKPKIPLLVRKSIIYIKWGANGLGIQNRVDLIDSFV